MKQKVVKECGICAYKYSCGYSALRSGKSTHPCCEPHLFARVQKNFWSYQNQRFEPESEIQKEALSNLTS
jgi:hypothetical protein